MTEKDNSTLGYNSSLYMDNMKRYQISVDKQLNVVNNILNNTEVVEFHDNEGKLIINATQDKIWFSKNVAFIFAIGSIKDEEDDELLNTVLSYFENNNESGFLMNHYRVLDYNDKLVIELENKLKIANGNYHVLLAPIVYASDEELNNAPELQFKHKGPVKKLVKWQQITEYMRELMSKYGLITNLIRKHDAMNYEFDKNVKEDKGVYYIGDTMNDDNDSEIDSNLAFQRELHDNYNERVRRGKTSRDGDVNEGTHISNRKNLYQQMYEDKYSNECMLDKGNINGVELRMNDVLPPEKTTEYQLYDDEATYVDGKNIFENVTVGAKCNIQKSSEPLQRRNDKQVHVGNIRDLKPRLH